MFFLACSSTDIPYSLNTFMTKSTKRAINAIMATTGAIIHPSNRVLLQCQCLVAAVFLLISSSVLQHLHQHLPYNLNTLMIKLMKRAMAAMMATKGAKQTASTEFLLQPHFLGRPWMRSM